MREKPKGVKGLSENDLRILSILLARRDAKKTEDRNRLMDEEGSSSNRQTAAQKLLEDFEKGGPQLDPTHRDWDKLTKQYDDMSGVGMTPRSKLLDEGLARDLLEEREILELGDEIDKLKGRGFQGQRKIVDYRSRLKKRRARKKEFDPEDQDQVTQKEYKKRVKEGPSAREKNRVKKMTNFERTLAIRKRLEEMLRDDGGKK